MALNDNFDNNTNNDSIIDLYPRSRDSRSPTPPTSPGELLDPYATSVTFDGEFSAFSSRTFLGPSQIHNFDAIAIENIAGGLTALPLAKHPDGGTKIEIDKHKAKGSDYPKVIGRGYDARHTKFTLMLFIDLFPGSGSFTSQVGTIWIKINTQFVMESIFPRPIENRRAVEVFHPALSAEGIDHLVIISRSLMYHVGKQIFHVDVEGIDTRYAQFQSSDKKSGHLKQKPVALNTPQKLWIGSSFAQTPAQAAATATQQAAAFSQLQAPKLQLASRGNGPGAFRVGRI